MKRILIIEDDAAQRKLFRTALQHDEHEIVEAKDGRTGLTLFRRKPCDLIVTDIFMPREDGIETIFDVKHTHPNVKIVAISGGGSWAQHGRSVGPDDALEIAKKFGADRTLKKPVNLQELTDIVHDLLNLQDAVETANDWTPLGKLLTGECVKTVLIIEDDVPQRRLYKAALEQAGYKVFEASDGQEGVEMFDRKPCDLVITDIFMPQEDGIETIFALKTQKDRAKIIAISGGGSWGQHGSSFGAGDPLTMAKRFGADRVLKKPIKLQTLVSIADELLKVKGRLQRY